MNFPEYFADAEANFSEAEVVILGVPFDKTSSFRFGAAKAPQAVRQASWNFETFDLRTGCDISSIRVHDYGDLDVAGLTSRKMVEQVQVFTSSIVKKKQFPLVIGGEHSITPGVLQAFPKDTAVICLDAHLDFRDTYEGDRFNHACVNRRISEYIDMENFVVLGVRSAEKHEYLEAQEQGLQFIDAYSICERGISQIISEILTRLNKKKVYCTLDIDVIDPAYAPGTSTPEPFGLTPFDIREILYAVSPQLIGFDIVEVCPPYDNGETAILAAKLLRFVISSLSKDRD